MSRTPKKLLHELRYGGDIYALAPDCDILLFLKAKAILYRLVRYPEMLHIYFEGREIWVFDGYMGEKAASRIVAEVGV